MGQARGSGKKTTLIVNIRSRRGANSFRVARRELGRLGVTLNAAYPAQSERELLSAARSALQEDIDLLVVGGGDGTISAAVDLLAGRRTVLGLLPLGTGNDFARTLGIPLDLADACRTIAEGEPLFMPAARLNDTHFLGMALIGQPAHVNHTVPSWLKRTLGRLAYPLAGLYALLVVRPFQAEIEVDGARFVLRTPLVVIGNSRFHGPTALALGGDTADRDRLVVQTPRDASLATLLRLAASFGLQRRPPEELLLTRAGRAVAVSATPRQEIDIDGEHRGWTPARAALVQGAVRVQVPRGAAALAGTEEARPAA